MSWSLRWHVISPTAHAFPFYHNKKCKDCSHTSPNSSLPHTCLLQHKREYGKHLQQEMQGLLPHITYFLIITHMFVAAQAQAQEASIGRKASIAFTHQLFPHYYMHVCCSASASTGSIYRKKGKHCFHTSTVSPYHTQYCCSASTSMGSTDRKKVKHCFHTSTISPLPHACCSTSASTGSTFRKKGKHCIHKINCFPATTRMFVAAQARETLTRRRASAHTSTISPLHTHVCCSASASKASTRRRARTQSAATRTRRGSAASTRSTRGRRARRRRPSLRTTLAALASFARWDGACVRCEWVGVRARSRGTCSHYLREYWCYDPQCTSEETFAMIRSLVRYILAPSALNACCGRWGGGVRTQSS